MQNDKMITGFRKAISNMLIQFRTIIDADKKMYMIQQTVLGVFKSGSFQPLPKIQYVLVAKRWFQPSCEACVVGDDDKMFYQVSLVYYKNRRIITHETKDADNAFMIADEIRGKLGLPIKDATKGYA